MIPNAQDLFENATVYTKSLMSSAVNSSEYYSAIAESIYLSSSSTKGYCVIL